MSARLLGVAAVGVAVGGGGLGSSCGSGTAAGGAVGGATNSSSSSKKSVCAMTSGPAATSLVPSAAQVVSRLTQNLQSGDSAPSPYRPRAKPVPAAAAASPSALASAVACPAGQGPRLGPRPHARRPCPPAASQRWRLRSRSPSRRATQRPPPVPPWTGRAQPPLRPPPRAREPPPRGREPPPQRPPPPPPALPPRASLTLLASWASPAWAWLAWLWPLPPRVQ
eukprot:scaffold26944_cov63-Phaeocystis_antarctica.AAC.3